MDPTVRVRRHYDRNAEEEWSRLDRHRTELAITLRAMAEALPRPPAAILDIGGGPGRYAIELTRQGYSATLLDLSAACLELCAEKAAAAGVTPKALVRGDARDLSRFGEATFDAVLLLGPLYHLLSEADRNRAITEAVRVLRPGGPLLAAFISRFAPFRHAAAFDADWVLRDPEYALSLLETGIHDRGQGFPNAYFAHPHEIRPLMERHGLITEGFLNCEGAVSMNETTVNELRGRDWEIWLDLNYRIATDSDALGCAEHLLYVGRKTG